MTDLPNKLNLRYFRKQEEVEVAVLVEHMEAGWLLERLESANQKVWIDCFLCVVSGVSDD